MASSAYDSYGSLSVKAIRIAEEGVRWHNDDDDTKYCEVKAVDPTGQHVLTLPNNTGTVLSSASTLDASKVGVNSLTAVDALANGDEFMLYDATASANRKVSAADLATFCGGGSGLPTGNTPGAVLVADSGGDFQSVAMSGHVQINATGSTTIQNNTVTNDMLTGSIAYGKLSLNNAIQNGDLAGSIQYNKLSLSNSVTNGDLAGSIENSKISSLSGVTAGTASASRAVVVDSNKDVSGLETVGLSVANFGGDQWRIKVDSGNLVMQFKDGPSWVTKHTFASN